MEKLELEKIVLRFRAAIESAENYRLIHKFYCDHREEYQAKYRIAPGFIQYTNRALKHGVMMELCRLYDKDSKSFSIIALHNVCIKNKQLFAKYVKGETSFDYDIKTVCEEFMSSYKLNKKSLDNIYNQRKKIWAHNDIAYVNDPTLAEKDFPVSWGEIETIIDSTRNFLIKLEQGLSGKYTTLRFADGLDVEKLFLAIDDNVLSSHSRYYD